MNASSIPVSFWFRWHLSEFLAAYNTEAGNAYKVSKGHLFGGDVEYTSSEIAQRHSALTSIGKAAKLLVVGGTKMQKTSDSDGTDSLIQRLVEVLHQYIFSHEVCFNQKLSRFWIFLTVDF